MTKSILVGILMLFPLLSRGQLSTSEFRDAASCGPYPLYFGVGYGHSWQMAEVEEISAAFFQNQKVRHRLLGVNGMVGASIIPKDSKVSYFVEVNFHVYSRNMRGELGRFTMSMDQLSLGGGVRYVIAPLFVIQGQVGSILLHNRKYNYRDASTLIEIHEDKNHFNEYTAKVRLSLLDPAGTEGGLGFYVEWGYNWLHKEGRESEVSDAVKMFDPGFDREISSTRRYGYFSAGIIVPFALRYK